MSFILDALKKSETERQRQTGPGFATIAGGSKRKGLPIWAMALAGLLLINLIVVLGVALWPEDQQPQITVQPIDRPISQSQAIPLPGPQNTDDLSTMNEQTQAADARPDVRSLAGEVGEPDSNSNESVSPASVTTAPGPTSTNGGSAVTTGNTSATGDQRGGFVVYQSTDRSVASRDLPTLSDLRSQGLLSIPDLHMDIHVYGDTEADRFVFINMRKYTKNDTLREGPVVEEILNDGVILSERGLRFFLPSD